MNKIQLVEKQYRNKFKKKEVALNTKHLKKQTIKVRKIEIDYRKYNHQLQKQNREQKSEKESNMKKRKKKL